MIYNYPYFGFPNYMNYYSNVNKKVVPAFQPKTTYTNYYNKQNKQNKQTLNYNKPKINNNVNNSINNNDKTPLFNLFGIQLYFDDILLICVIFFLYNEEIEDNYLLLALVLLLLS